MGMLGYSTGSSVVMRRYTVSRMGIVIVSGSFPRIFTRGFMGIQMAKIPPEISSIYPYMGSHEK